MPDIRIKIDDREVKVAPGATILDAARKLGIDIPTLCFLEGYRPSTSCLVCMVKIRGRDRLVPSCGTAVVDGMEVESDTPEVHRVRRTALELLLSDHVGDCLAPCLFACPARMDIPLMLRQIDEENVRDAIATIKRDIALPAVLGRICAKPCEKGCRRSAADGPVAVCRLKQYAADRDLASDDPYLPECRPAGGKRVAIVGAGPTGLSAAYYLRRQGHGCAIFDDQSQAGGRLRRIDRDELPPEVLDAEIEQIIRLGVELHLETPVGKDSPGPSDAAKPSLDDLRRDYDAVLIACGRIEPAAAERWGLKAGKRGIEVDKATFQTGTPGLFAAGNAIRPHGLVVRSVADGKEAAAAVGQYLAGDPVTGAGRPFSVRIGRVSPDEMPDLLAMAGDAPRREPAGGDDDGYVLDEAHQQAGRCLRCGCRAHGSCKLERYAARYGADPGRYRSRRRPLEVHVQPSGVIYEPGKCIDCELCIQIAESAGEPLGLTFVGRGFDVRVGVPLGRSLEEALGKVAAECVAACPTAALSFVEQDAESELPILGQP